MNWMYAMDVALYVAIGAVLGAVHFALLLRTVRMHASHAAVVRVIPLYALRFGATVLGFWVVAQQGALPLLYALLGFMAARFAVQRRIGSG